MLEIKVLGPGCPKCKKLEESARQAVEELGIDAAVIKVDDINEILNYDILSTPGLVVNGHVVHSGRIALKKEIMQLLRPYL